MTTIYIRFLWRKRRRERRRGGDRKRESREKKENENKNESIFFRDECSGILYNLIVIPNTCICKQD